MAKASRKQSKPVQSCGTMYGQRTLCHRGAVHTWLFSGSPRGAAALLKLGPFEYGKTHDRSVLGTMNEMSFCLKVQMERLSGLPQNDDELAWLSTSINEMPCSMKGRKDHVIPSKEFSRLL